ncbi:hypothetical protein GCM10020254_04660 [Streptomyces goshikiensis]
MAKGGAGVRTGRLPGRDTWPRRLCRHERPLVTSPGPAFRRPGSPPAAGYAEKTGGGLRTARKGARWSGDGRVRPSPGVEGQATPLRGAFLRTVRSRRPAPG